MNRCLPGQGACCNPAANCVGLWFSTLDLKYAYGQVALSEETSRHCNFQIVGGAATGMYRFKTGFYGLTTMPTEFQQIMDTLLQKVDNIFAFIDDVMIVTQGSKAEHMAKVTEVLKHWTRPTSDCMARNADGPNPQRNGWDSRYHPLE